MPQFLDDLDVQGAMVAQATASQTTQVVKRAAGQTAPFTEFETSTGEVLASVDYTGRFKGLFSAYDQAALLDSPVGYWPLSDPAGSSSAQDLSGGAIGALAVNGGVTFGNVGPTGDPLETAALFDGSTGYLKSSVGAGLTGALTLEGWVNHQGVAWSSGLEVVASDGGSNYLAVSNGLLVCSLEIAGTVVTVTGAAVPTTGPHYLRAAWSGSVITLTMDDTAVTDTPTVGAVTWGAATFVGSLAGASDWFNGQIAKVGIYPSALPTARQTVRAAAVWKERTDVYTTSQTITVPGWANTALIQAKGGGGGPGGSGCPSSAVAQVPGGAPGNGALVITEMPVTPGQSCVIVIGSGGTAGAPGATAGSNGTAGSAGGSTTVTLGGNLVIAADGGAQGQASTANATTAVGSGAVGVPGYVLSGTEGIPGAGAAQTQISAPQADGWFGESGAGPATATLGGGAAGAPQTPGRHGSTGAGGASSTANGIRATAAPVPNSGVGGPPGGAPAMGGVGGTGLAGAAGYVNITWKAA